VRILGVAERAGGVMVISLSFFCDEQVRCELACGPSYVSVVAVACLCAQAAQPAITGLLRVVLMRTVAVL
jgi:hypothetical protein